MFHISFLKVLVLLGNVIEKTWKNIKDFFVFIFYLRNNPTILQEIAIKSPKLTFNSAQRSDLRLISFTSAIAQEGKLEKSAAVAHEGKLEKSAAVVHNDYMPKVVIQIFKVFW